MPMQTVISARAATTVGGIESVEIYYLHVLESVNIRHASTALAGLRSPPPALRRSSLSIKCDITFAGF